MTEVQLSQFEAFVDATDPNKPLDEREQAANKVMQWFEQYMPNYQDAADFQSLKAAAPDDISPIVLLSEYGSLKWLEMNRPDYKQVVAAELDLLKSEITTNRDSILGAGA
jgi:hypothetical protein